MTAPRNDEAREQAGNVAKQKNFSSNHSPTDRLLSLLAKVKRTGNGTWLARCPAHGDKRASLSIRETGSGATLIHCFAGCTVHEVVGAAGLNLSDLFPPRPISHRTKGERRPFPCADAFRAVAFESTIVALAGAAIIAGEPFSQFDKDRLLVAVGRINDALSAAVVFHG